MENENENDVKCIFSKRKWMNEMIDVVVDLSRKEKNLIYFALAMEPMARSWQKKR